MYNNTVDNYNVNQKEYCFNVEDISSNPTSMKAYIPILMSKIKKSSPRQQTEQLSTINICNAPDCKPHINKRVTTQNYITLKRYPGETSSISHKANEDGIIPEGNRFIVDILHNDILTMYFTGIM